MKAEEKKERKKEMKGHEAEQKVMENVEGKFWTRQNEMVEELEELDYEVTTISYEYLVVTDIRSEQTLDEEYVLYLGHSNGRIWIEDAQEVY